MKRLYVSYHNYLYVFIKNGDRTYLPAITNLKQKASVFSTPAYLTFKRKKYIIIHKYLFRGDTENEY